MKIFVVNGWASSGEAWNLCKFRRDKVFSYVEALDGAFGEALSRCDEDVICVGWSMGTSIILQNLADHRDKIKGVVLLAGTCRMMADDNWPGMNALRLRALKRGLKISLAEPPSRQPYKVVPYADDADENLERGLEFLRTLDCRSALAEASAMGHFNSLRAYLFQSENDAVVPKHNAEFLANVFPMSKVVYVKGSEHALPVVIPGQIDEAVNELMQGALSDA